MPPETAERLADHTSLRLGGPAAAWVRATTEQELTEALTTAAAPVLVLGGGSNLVVADAGFDGTVVALNSRGIDVRSDPEGGGVVIRARAGEPWDALVSRAVESGWSGIEALSGIPGRVGATPVQNVGAYGQEVSQTIASVQAWERVAARELTLPSAECRFGYRTSRFKADPSRHVVVSVTFRLRRARLGSPVSYAELARTLGVQLGRDGRQSAGVAAHPREVAATGVGRMAGRGHVEEDVGEGGQRAVGMGAAAAAARVQQQDAGRQAGEQAQLV